MTEQLTDSERHYVDKLITEIGPRMIRAKTCWRSAQLLMQHDEGREKRLRYWESGRPIQHAWVTINGKVVDVTDEAVARKCKRMKIAHTCHDYSQGVEIAWAAVLENMLRTKEHGPVVDWDGQLRAEIIAVRDGVAA